MPAGGILAGFWVGPPRDPSANRPPGAPAQHYILERSAIRELMEDLLKDKVCLLRQRIKTTRDGKALYRELSDLLLRAGKISAAMNILEKSLSLSPGDAEPS